MNLGLSGRAAIVTGASRGIGAAVASELVQEGVDVALIARNAASLEQLAAELSARGDGAKAVAVAADLADGGASAAAISEAIERLGRVDILVNNAGASRGGSFDEIDDTAWTEAFELKLLGYVRTIRAVLPAMREQGHGRIVNVVGMAGRYATGDYVLGAFNAALLHLTKALAQDLASSGVSIAAVNPVMVDTDRVRNLLEGRARKAGIDPAAFRDEFIKTLPLRRMASAEEMARLIVLMASPVTAYVTGSALQADGGMSTGVI
jgi:NAD(P)-dependent dehydrogenase (short-subunit alcohol dehydrogenase family)